MTLAEKLREKLLELREVMTFDTIEVKTGVSRMTLHRIENVKNYNPSLDTYQKLDDFHTQWKRKGKV